MRFTSSVLLKNNRTLIQRSEVSVAACFRTLVKSKTGPLSGREAVLVELNGIEPMTSCLQSRRSPN